MLYRLKILIPNLGWYRSRAKFTTQEHLSYWLRRMNQIYGVKASQVKASA